MTYEQAGKPKDAASGLGQICTARRQERLDRHREAAPRATSIGYNFRVRFLAALVLSTLAAPSLHAEPTIHLRFATIAPEGTGWAREVKAFAREIEDASNGRVAMHVYLGGIAGDDAEMGRRMRKDQLDGALSAGMLCQDVAPGVRRVSHPGAACRIAPRART